MQNMKFHYPHIFYIIFQQDSFFEVYQQECLFVNIKDHQKQNSIIAILDYNFFLKDPICEAISCPQ